MTSGLHIHVHSASFSLPVTCALVLVALIYVRGWLRLRNAFPKVIPFGRVATFLAGLFAVWIADGSPLVTSDHRLLTFHMAKHLLLMAVGPPLILWGSPLPPLLSGLPKWMHLDALIRSRAVQSLAHPVACWMAATATVVVWHLPAVFQLALQHHAWHDVEDASFLVAGLLFWWPVVRPWPSAASVDRWSVPLYLFLAMLPCDILSGFLVFCGRVVYPFYLTSPQPFHLSAIQDQEFAGALMWVAITLIYAIPATVITMQILSSGEPHYRTRKERV